MQTILVVDDDKFFASACERVLAGAGFHVVTAEDGNAALLALKLGNVDLVLCDLFMPEKDGLETMEAVRARWPNVPIVAMSGGGQFALAKEVLPQTHYFGANAVLMKPFSPSDLMDTVNRLLARTIG